MFETAISDQGKVDRIESLRLILVNQQNTDMTHDEAFEIGESLITFFEILSDDSALNGT